MNYRELAKTLTELLEYMDGNIKAVEDISNHLQERIYKMLLSEMLLFDIQNGRLVPEQDFTQRIMAIEAKLNGIFGQKNFNNAIQEFTGSFQTIEQRNIAMQRSFNDLEVKIKEVSQPRKMLYEQTIDALSPKNGIKIGYIQPIKYLIIQQVTAGIGIQDSIELLKKWNDGESIGKYTLGTPPPNLAKYATQIARDSAYGVHRNFNNIVKDKYGLNAVGYVGSVVKDSRPLCEYLVSLRRPILLSEIDDLFSGKIPPEAMKFAEKKTKDGFLQGTVEGTNGDNFCKFCGGRNCRHQGVAVRV